MLCSQNPTKKRHSKPSKSSRPNWMRINFYVDASTAHNIQFKKSPDSFTDEAMKNASVVLKYMHSNINTSAVENHSVWHFRNNSQSIYLFLICISNRTGWEREREREWFGIYFAKLISISILQSRIEYDDILTFQQVYYENMR